MDPDANLKEQLELAARSQKIWDECSEDGCFTEEQEIELSQLAFRLSELVEALDGWITKGGHYPKRWRNK
jgi:hypothetical protein